MPLLGKRLRQKLYSDGCSPVLVERLGGKKKDVQDVNTNNLRLDYRQRQSLRTIIGEPNRRVKPIPRKIPSTILETIGLFNFR